MRPDLRDARSKAGLTQTELAEKIGCDQATISRYETGTSDVTKELAPAIATALGLDLIAVLYPAPVDEAEKAA